MFQILSMLLELHSTRVPEPYMALFQHLLVPVLWERPGNIPPLVRLLQAYVEKGASQIDPNHVVSRMHSYHGNIPPPVRLLQAYVEKGASQIDPNHVVCICVYLC